MTKKFHLILIALALLGCGDRQTQSDNAEHNEPIEAQSVNCLDSFLIKYNLKDINLQSLNIAEIEEKGIVLNKTQKNKLFKVTFHFPIDDECFVYWGGAIPLKDNIITAIYLIRYSDLERFYLINYNCSADFALSDYLNTDQIAAGDLLFGGKEIEVYFSGTDTLFVSESKEICIKSTYSEFTHTFADNKTSLSYKKNTSKVYSITDTGKFKLLKRDSVMQGKKFSFEDVPIEEVRAMYPNYKGVQ